MKEDDDRHYSECKHYEICTNFYMYCKVLKRRIAARKKSCKHYESFIKTENEKIHISFINHNVKYSRNGTNKRIHTRSDRVNNGSR